MLNENPHKQGTIQRTEYAQAKPATGIENVRKHALATSVSSNLQTQISAEKSNQDQALEQKGIGETDSDDGDLALLANKFTNLSKRFFFIFDK